MAWFQGVKNFIFGKGREDEQQDQQAGSQQREAGHKRSRQSSSSKKGHGPVLQDAGYAANGGVQGLGWYTATLQLDADGDAAHAFYQEQPSSSQLQQVEAAGHPSRQQCKLKGVQQGHVLLAGAR